MAVARPLAPGLTPRLSPLTVWWSRPVEGLRVRGAGVAAASPVPSKSLKVHWLTEAPGAPGPWFGGWAFDGQRLWEGFAAERWIIPSALAWEVAGRWHVAGLAETQSEAEACREEIAVGGAETVGPGNGSSKVLRRVGDDSQGYLELVGQALASIELAELDKVVVARELLVESEVPIAVEAVLERLEADNPACWTYLVRGTDGSALVGSTPELLCESTGSLVRTEALAGTAAPDDVLALSSPKVQREHALVAEGIHRVLTRHTQRVERGLTEPRGFERVAHLRTPFVARLRPTQCALRLARSLHPTAAVSGAPGEDAMRWLRAHEPFARGWYAGAIGAVGPGRVSLAVALRSARLTGARAHVYVGAGVVRGSKPSEELAETERKAQTMWAALGAPPPPGEHPSAAAHFGHRHRETGRVDSAGSPTLNEVWAATIAGALVRGGVRAVVIGSGSRSAPLAVACAGRPDLTCWPVIDERSGGFVALGLAKALGGPAAVVVTSGTAAANLLPAVVEASAGGTPLVVLTADRPWELHGGGAPQTIDQSSLFGRFPCRTELLPEPSEQTVRHLGVVVAEAVGMAAHRRGPVHLNVPFREPLEPSRAEPLVLDPPVATTVLGAPTPSVEHLWQALRSALRPVILCGVRERCDGFAEGVVRLAHRLGAPVLAEAASGVRYGAPTISGYAAILRSAANRLRPDVVLRFGAAPTLKELSAFLDAAPIQLHVVEGRPTDPARRADVIVHGDAQAVVEALLARWEGAAPPSAGGERPYLEAWCTEQAKVGSATREDGGLTGPAVARELVAQLAPGSALVVSNSLAIREVDSFALRAQGPIRVFVNRGANGIDGVMSTAVGVAACCGSAHVLIGDLAAIHDANAWVAARQLGVSITAVVVNNDGGGIFSFLPIADRTPFFTRFFTMPHGSDLAHLAGLGGAALHRPTSVVDFRRSLSVASRGGRHLIEVAVARDQLVDDHLRALSALSGVRPEAQW